MKAIVSFWLAASLATAAFGQSAKALFGDVNSGVSITTSGNPPKQTKKAPSTVPSTPGTQKSGGATTTTVADTKGPDPAVTGLMYWVELRTDKDQLLRVNSDRVFHSGERIRIHVSSNVDGHLVMMQSQDGGAYQMLFPTAKTTDNRVQKFRDQVFPSATSWFRFDEKPGELRIMMMVTSDTAPQGAPLQVASAGTPGNPEVVANDIKMKIEKLRGSKALVVEDDKSDATAPASYVVVDSRKESAMAGAVAVEVKLNHRAQ